MEKSFKISSTSLSNLNETLSNLSLNEKISKFTPVIVEADGKFTSVIKTDSDFNPNDLGNAIDAEEENVENKETKQQLLNKATEALKQTVANSKELDEILKKIKQLSKDTSGNQWEVNKQGNTASLKDKNAFIFKQNDYLCLSHNGKIELFKDVCELRKWLEENNYPLPNEDIVIHESVEIKEEDETKQKRNWYDLVKAYQDKQKDNFLKKEPEENKNPRNDQNFYTSLNREPDSKPSKKIHNYTNLDVEECFAGTATSALGNVQILGANTKKKKKEEDLQEAVSFLPGTNSSGNGKAANLLATQLKNPNFIQDIKDGKITLPGNLKDYFMAFQMILADYNVKAQTSDLFNSAMKNITSKLTQDKPQVSEKQIEDALNNPEKYQGLTEILKNTLESDKFAILSNEDEQTKFLISVVKEYFKQSELSPNDYQSISEYMNDIVLCIKAGRGKDINKISLDEMHSIAENYLNEHPEEKENLVTFKSGDSLAYSKEQDENEKIKLNRTGDRENRAKWQSWCYSALPKDKATIDRLYHALFDSDSNAKNNLGPEDPAFKQLIEKLQKKNPDFVYTYDYEDIPNVTGNKNINNQPQKQEINPKVMELLQKHNIDPNSDLGKDMIANFNLQQKESTHKLNVFESSNKHSWFNKVLGQRLVEDDSPADFAQGTPLSADASASVASNTDTSNTTTTNNIDPNLNFSGDTSTPDTNGFGDVDISVGGGYSPEDEEQQAMAMPNMPEYEIIDVLENEDNPDDIKVKVRDTDTGKIEIKDLSEIDV